MVSESVVGWLKGFVSKDPLQKYIESYNFAEFKLSDIDDIDDINDIDKPIYKNTGNKLKDDMNYLTRIISFAMELKFD
jgi:hypothetical protein